MATVLQPTAPTIIVDDDIDDDIVWRIPRNAYTLVGFRAWVLGDDFPEKQRVTFLNGEIYLDMSKEEISTHASVKTAVAGTTLNLNRELDFGDMFINGVLVTNVEADVSNNPDMVGISWKSISSGKVRYVQNKNRHEMEIEGSPDWLLEIVSDGSVTKDTVDLRDAYHRAGVREYWIIDARGEEIVFQILHWRKSGFAAAPRKSGWQRSRVFGRSFQLSRTRDRRGGWRYKLAAKEE